MRFHFPQHFASAVLPVLVATTMIPSVAIAQTRVNTEILLEPAEEEPYNVFIGRAKANAAVEVQALFDQDLLRTEVRVTILGQRSATIAPVLKLQVTCQEWTDYPDPEIWSRYFPESRKFLRFTRPTQPNTETNPAEAESLSPETTGNDAAEQEEIPILFGDEVPGDNQTGNTSTDGITFDSITSSQETPGEMSLEEVRAAIEAGTLTEADFNNVSIEEVLEAIDAGTSTITTPE